MYKYISSYFILPGAMSVWKVLGKKKILLLSESGFDDNRKQIILKQEECRTFNCQMKLEN